MFQGGTEHQVRASGQAASSKRPEAHPGEGYLAWRKWGTNSLVCMNIRDKQSCGTNRVGLGSVLAVFLAARLC